jgi:hypothetical protein
MVGRTLCGCHQRFQLFYLASRGYTQPRITVTVTVTVIFITNNTFTFTLDIYTV